MTAVMQPKAEASTDVVCNPLLKSVAARRLDNRLKAEDDLASKVLASVVLNEHLEFLATKEPNGKLTFRRTLPAMADWALDMLGNVEQFDIPAKCHETRMFLCGLVVQGWIASRDTETGKRCATALRHWPLVEADAVSAVIRKHFDNSAGFMGIPGTSVMLGKFFAGAGKMLPVGDSEVWRMVGRAIGRYASMGELVLVGEVLSSLGGEYNVGLRDLVGDLCVKEVTEIARCGRLARELKQVVDPDHHAYLTMPAINEVVITWRENHPSSMSHDWLPGRQQLLSDAKQKVYDWAAKNREHSPDFRVELVVDVYELDVDNYAEAKPFKHLVVKVG